MEAFKQVQNKIRMMLNEFPCISLKQLVREYNAVTVNPKCDFNTFVDASRNLDTNKEITLIEIFQEGEYDYILTRKDTKVLKPKQTYRRPRNFYDYSFVSNGSS